MRTLLLFLLITLAGCKVVENPGAVILGIRSTISEDNNTVKIESDLLGVSVSVMRIRSPHTGKYILAARNSSESSNGAFRLNKYEDEEISFFISNRSTKAQVFCTVRSGRVGIISSCA